VPVGDAAALASEVVRLIEDPARRNGIAGAARAWTLAHDADWTAAAFERIYAAAAKSTIKESRIKNSSSHC